MYSELKSADGRVVAKMYRPYDFYIIEQSTSDTLYIPRLVYLCGNNLRVNEKKNTKSFNTWGETRFECIYILLKYVENDVCINL